MRIKIPDYDMLGWIKTLREGNFSNDEIDIILSFLNKNYFLANKAPLIDWVLRQEENFLFLKEKKILNHEERRQYKMYIEKMITK